MFKRHSNQVIADATALHGSDRLTSEIGKHHRNLAEPGVYKVLLPEFTLVVPPKSAATPFGCRWVRKTTFLALLRSFRR